VINPDNNITEIHENNNKGFVPLSVYVPLSIEHLSSDEIPGQFRLFQNYPNPFNPVTNITYQLPKTSKVELYVYNLLGQKVATLISKKQQAGHYQAEWDASGFASGLYFYRLEAGNFVQTRKMLLLK
jgi:hypothetical protein